MFSFIKEKVKKIYSGFTNKVSNIFAGKKLDENLVKELSDLLIEADTGVKTTSMIVNKLVERAKQENIEDGEQAKDILEKILCEILSVPHAHDQLPTVLLMVGVNGSGKTSFVGKLGYALCKAGKKVLLVAGDTFRAAAVEQLAEWGKKTGVDVFTGQANQDPASVVFDACKKFKEEPFDHIIIDTAGRLQTKVNLMKELEKIRKIIDRQLPEYAVDTESQENLKKNGIATWLAIDAMLGQNSLRQAEVFHESTQVNGIVLTKLDGTGKGGIVFSIADTFGVPIEYVTFGEKPEDSKVFDIQEYVAGLLHE